MGAGVSLVAWGGVWKADAWARGTWVFTDTAPPTGGWGNVTLPPRRETPTRRRPLVGELHGDLVVQTRADGSMRLFGRAETEAALEQLAIGRLYLGHGQLMAAAVADQRAEAALRLRGRKLRHRLLISGAGEGEMIDVDALAILLLLGDL